MQCKMLKLQEDVIEAQKMRAEAAEAKLAAVEERDRWRERIRELSKVQEEKDKYYAEVLELERRPLKSQVRSGSKGKGPGRGSSVVR